ncbi:family 43 glycosylhydrolase [uncultured Draconibacterium sp.]|uniref:family 43 glycosylhydrolase n=1 Tax=uncultured Draconibacterium sp. TaxID=1573823 RepID=UPI003217B0CD
MRTTFLITIIVLAITACTSSTGKRQKQESSPTYNSILPGQVWLDTEGKPIQAHGFQVLYNDGTYYWYGENKEFTKSGSNIWTYGIRCYTSKDFYNWEDRGLIIPPDTLDPHSPMHPSQGIDRPHIIYNDATGKYVCWIKLMGDDGQFMAVLTADDILGPYQLVNRGFRPNGFESGDFDLYVDEDTKQGYIWFERPHWEMICAELTDDYTNVTDKFSVHFSGLLPPDTREAPTHFIANGKHFMYTSGTSGYSPNQSLISTFDDYHSNYINLGNPHPKDTTHTSYCSQITDVIKIPGKKNLYVVMADRWMPDACGTDLPAKELVRIREWLKDLKPKPQNFNDVKLLDRRGDKRTDWDVTYKATYVWLPITWENGVPNIYWQEEWKLEDFE